MVAATRTFVPGLNKEGFSKLTLTGFEYKHGEKTNEETEEVREWELYQIKFECKAKYRGMNPQKISITTGVKYAPDNILGKSLKALGIDVDGDVEMTLDEDGFEQEAISETLDADGFEDDEAPAEIDVEALVNDLVGQNYKAKVSRGKDGFWGINLDTLTAL